MVWTSKRTLSAGSKRNGMGYGIGFGMDSSEPISRRIEQLKRFPGTHTPPLASETRMYPLESVILACFRCCELLHIKDQYNKPPSLFVCLDDALIYFLSL